MKYSLNKDNSASVEQKIEITNNLSQIYLKEYLIKLAGNDVENIKATDSYGDIIDKVEKQKDQTTVFLKFSQPVVGKDKSNLLQISYKINNFAKVKGKTYEIQLPDYKSSGNQRQTDVKLSVPDSFGSISYSSIPISQTHDLTNQTEITINRIDNIRQPVLLVFGNRQLFDFKLNYYLQNDSNVRIKTEIALPPDTNSQQIVYSQINPQPVKVYSDPDGNWLAEYVIEPSQNVDITASGQAKIFPPKSGTPHTIDNDVYLQSQKYWPTDNPELVETAASLKTPKKIYDFVVNTLTYDYSRIDSAKRMGAENAILTPEKSLCTEFTDLFVTLSRINGIPAREIEGYSYSNNQKIKPTNAESDVLHAWPQYFDQKSQQWLSVDPTWEKTTNGIDFFKDLDLNHITFVIHGIKSDYPPPPGSYKRNNQQKSIFVEFANRDLEPKHSPPQLSFLNNQLTVKNINLNSLNNVTVKISNSSWSRQLPTLPPLADFSIDTPSIPFWKNILPSAKNYKFEVYLPDSDQTHYLTVVNKNHYLYLSIGIFALIGLLCVSGIILAVSIKHEKNP